MLTDILYDLEIKVSNSFSIPDIAASDIILWFVTCIFITVTEDVVAFGLWLANLLRDVSPRSMAVLGSHGLTLN